MESYETPNPDEPTPTPNEGPTINIDIQELEMLRDIITYKAQVLGLQKRTFKTKEQENKACKRALIDFILTLFGYLGLPEIQQLLLKICKEYSLTPESLLPAGSHQQQSKLSLDLPDTLLLTQRANSFNPQSSPHQCSPQKSMDLNTIHYSNTQVLSHSPVKQEESLQNITYIAKRLEIAIDEELQIEGRVNQIQAESKSLNCTPRVFNNQNGEGELRKSYAVNAKSFIFNQPNDEYSSALFKLEAATATLKDLIKQVQIASNSGKIKDAGQSGKLVRYSISRRMDDSMRVSVRNNASSLNQTEIHMVDPKLDQDRKQNMCNKIRSIHEQLMTVMVEDLQCEDEAAAMLLQQQDLFGFFDERLQPQAYQSQAEIQEPSFHIEQMISQRQRLQELSQIRNSQEQQQNQQIFKVLTTSQSNAFNQIEGRDEDNQIDNIFNDHEGFFSQEALYNKKQKKWESMQGGDSLQGSLDKLQQIQNKRNVEQERAAKVFEQFDDDEVIQQEFNDQFVVNEELQEERKEEVYSSSSENQEFQDGVAFKDDDDEIMVIRFEHVSIGIQTDEFEAQFDSKVPDHKCFEDFGVQCAGESASQGLQTELSVEDVGLQYQAFEDKEVVLQELEYVNLESLASISLAFSYSQPEIKELRQLQTETQTSFEGEDVYAQTEHLLTESTQIQTESEDLCFDHYLSIQSVQINANHVLELFRRKVCIDSQFQRLQGLEISNPKTSTSISTETAQTDSATDFDCQVELNHLLSNQNILIDELVEIKAQKPLLVDEETQFLLEIRNAHIQATSECQINETQTEEKTKSSSLTQTESEELSLNSSLSIQSIHLKANHVLELFRRKIGTDPEIQSLGGIQINKPKVLNCTYTETDFLETSTEETQADIRLSSVSFECQTEQRDMVTSATQSELNLNYRDQSLLDLANNLSIGLQSEHSEDGQDEQSRNQLKTQYSEQTCQTLATEVDTLQHLEVCARLLTQKVQNQIEQKTLLDCECQVESSLSSVEVQVDRKKSLQVSNNQVFLEIIHEKIQTIEFETQITTEYSTQEIQVEQIEQKEELTQEITNQISFVGGKQRIDQETEILIETKDQQTIFVIELQDQEQQYSTLLEELSVSAKPEILVQLVQSSISPPQTEEQRNSASGLIENQDQEIQVIGEEYTELSIAQIEGLSLIALRDQLREELKVIRNQFDIQIVREESKLAYEKVNHALDPSSKHKASHKGSKEQISNTRTSMLPQKANSVDNQNLALGVHQRQLTKLGWQDRLEQESSEEVIPAQLMRFMKFKRERSYLLFQEGDLVLLDGLNNSIDVFKADDFGFISSLDTKENNPISALKVDDMVFVGCHNRLIQVYKLPDFKEICKLESCQSTYCLLRFSNHFVMMGQRRGHIEFIDTHSMSSILSLRIPDAGNIIQLVQMTKEEQIALVTDQGLYFINIKVDYDSQCVDAFKEQESYFQGKHVRGLSIIGDNGQQLCSILDDDQYLHVINREQKSVVQKIYISEFVGNICIRERRGVLFVRNEEGIFLVDVEKNKAKMIIKSQTQLAPFPQYQLVIRETDDEEEEDAILIQVLVIEFDGNNSTLKRFEMNDNFLQAVFEVEFPEVQ